MDGLLRERLFLSLRCFGRAVHGQVLQLRCGDVGAKHKRARQLVRRAVP